MIIRKLPRCRTIMVIVKVATSVYTGNYQEVEDIGTPWDISSRRKRPIRMATELTVAMSEHTTLGTKR